MNMRKKDIQNIEEINKNKLNEYKYFLKRKEEKLKEIKNIILNKKEEIKRDESKYKNVEEMNDEEVLTEYNSKKRYQSIFCLPEPTIKEKRKYIQNNRETIKKTLKRTEYYIFVSEFNDYVSLKSKTWSKIYFDAMTEINELIDYFDFDVELIDFEYKIIEYPNLEICILPFPIFKLKKEEYCIHMHSTLNEVELSGMFIFSVDKKLPLVFEKYIEKLDDLRSPIIDEYKTNYKNEYVENIKNNFLNSAYISALEKYRYFIFSEKNAIPFMTAFDLNN